MCCGRGYDTTRVTRVTQCECKFHWCCAVRCKECRNTVDVHTCKAPKKAEWLDQTWTYKYLTHPYTSNFLTQKHKIFACTPYSTFNLGLLQLLFKDFESTPEGLRCPSWFLGPGKKLTGDVKDRAAPRLPTLEVSRESGRSRGLQSDWVALKHMVKAYFFFPLHWLPDTSFLCKRKGTWRKLFFPTWLRVDGTEMKPLSLPWVSLS